MHVYLIFNLQATRRAEFEILDAFAQYLLILYIGQLHLFSYTALLHCPYYFRPIKTVK